MKIKYLPICLIVFCGCVLPQFDSRLSFETKEEVIEWVADNIEVVSDHDRWGGDRWQTPEETLELMTGDCEDIVLLDMHLLEEIGVDSRLVVIELKNGDWHACIRIDGDLIEAQTGHTYGEPQDIKYEMSYEESMRKAAR
jgi:hypothetical protein